MKIKKQGKSRRKLAEEEPFAIGSLCRECKAFHETNMAYLRRNSSDPLMKRLLNRNYNKEERQFLKRVMAARKNGKGPLLLCSHLYSLYKEIRKAAQGREVLGYDELRGQASVC